jgi:predicted GNAT superfamily acetyltransferase
MLDCAGMSVLVRPARERGDYDACVRLQREVWGLSDLEITSAIQLVATVHAGGSLFVAESAGETVGFCYAFAALRGGEAHLHSDMLAVRPAARGLGVGRRLKWAQREEALRRGLRLVTWTFDPMRAPNARLNLHHLGAVAREVLPDFYGATSSALHHGLATDRLFARWELDDPQVARRAAGETATPPDFDSLPKRAPEGRQGGVTRRCLRALSGRESSGAKLRCLRPWRAGATGRTTTRSTSPRRASPAGPRGAAPGGRGRR